MKKSTKKEIKDKIKELEIKKYIIIGFIFMLGTNSKKYGLSIKQLDMILEDLIMGIRGKKWKKKSPFFNDVFKMLRDDKTKKIKNYYRVI